MQVRSRDEQKKRILIAHYRVGHTDGVSLEIEKRRETLEGMGHHVFLLSGPLNNGADFVIPELEYDREPISGIRRNSVEECTAYSSAGELKEAIFSLAEKIGKDLDFIFDGGDFDLVYVHNMLSMAVNLPASIALVRSLQKFGLPCIGVHHDFYWAGDFTTHPTFPFVEELLEEFLIPRGNSVRHIVINSIDYDKMQQTYGIKPEINYDVFDFEGHEFHVDNYNRDFRSAFGLQEEDLVVLHATRIVPNKTIEFAVQFVQGLQRLRRRLESRQLYDGRRFSAENRIILLLPGRLEAARHWYKKQLEKYASEMGVEALFIGDEIESERREEKGRKIYSFWDSYAVADLVTYTSIWEGWGNQFIEAVVARKNLVVFEYPVYRTDISREGYHIISLGSEYSTGENGELHCLPEEQITVAAEEAIDLLQDGKKYREWTEKNYHTGLRHHSFTTLRSYLHSDMEWLEEVYGEGEGRGYGQTDEF